MKRKQITAILMSAILTVSACMPMNSINAMAAENAGAGATEVEAETTTQKSVAAAQELADPSAAQEPEAEPTQEPTAEPQQEPTVEPTQQETTETGDSGSDDKKEDSSGTASTSETTSTDGTTSADGTASTDEPAADPDATDHAADPDATDPAADSTVADPTAVDPTNEEAAEEVQLGKPAKKMEYNDFESAVDITADSSVEFTITDTSSYYMFRFIPARTGTYRFYMHHNGYIYLYDEDWQLANSYDSDWDSPSIEYELRKGKTYYFEVAVYGEATITAYLETVSVHSLEVEGYEDENVAVTCSPQNGAEQITLSVIAESDYDITYRWTDVMGEEVGTDSGYTFKPHNNIEYYCTISDGNETYVKKFHLYLNHFMVDGASPDDPYAPFIYTAEYDQTTQLHASISADDMSQLYYEWSVGHYVDEYGGYWSYEQVATGNGLSSIETEAVTGPIYYKCNVNDQYGNSAEIFYNVYVENNFKAYVIVDPDNIDVDQRYANLECVEGDDYTFKVGAQAADMTGITYQWKNGDEVIDGATSNEFTVSNATGREYYSCVVTDKYGTAIECYFSFTSIIHPYIEDGYGGSIYLDPGESTTLKPYFDTNLGDRLSYTWHYNNEVIPGETGETLDLDGTALSGTYKVIATYRDLSAYVSYTVTRNNNFRLVAKDSARISVLAGAPAELEVVATATDMEGITYQWYIVEEDEDDAINILIEGANTSKYTVSSVTSNSSYLCTAIDKYNTKKSVYFSVSVDNNLSVHIAGESANTNDADIYVDPGETARLEVAVTAYDKSQLTYEWYKETNGEDDVMVENTSDIFEFAPTKYTYVSVTVKDQFGNQASAYFYVYINNAFMVNPEAYASDGSKLTTEVGTDDSEYINVKVYVPSRRSDESVEMITLKTNATVENGDIHYSWRDDDYEDLGDGAEKNVKAASNWDDYSCSVSDDYGNSRYISFDIIIDNQLVAYPEGAPGSDTKYIYAAPGTEVTLTTIATAKIMDNMSYDWNCYNNDGWIGDALTVDANSAKLNADDFYQVHCYVYDGFSSKEVTFYVYPDNHLLVYPENASTMWDGSYSNSVTIDSQPGETIDLHVCVEADNKDSITYSWSKDVKTANIAGEYEYASEAISETGDTLRITADETTKYYCTVKDGFGGFRKVNFEVQVGGLIAYPEGAAEVDGMPSSRVAIASEAGGTKTLRVITIAPENEPLTYKWTSGPLNDSGWWPLEEGKDSTTNELTIDLDTAQRYLCVVSDTHGNQALAYFYVNVGGVRLTSNVGTPVLVGDNSYVVKAPVKVGVETTLQAIPVGSSAEGLTFKWLGDEYDTIQGATGNSYTFSGGVGTRYQCRVTDANGVVSKLTFELVTDNELVANGAVVRADGTRETGEIAGAGGTIGMDVLADKGEAVTLAMEASCLNNKYMHYEWVDALGRTIGEAATFPVMAEENSTYTCRVSDSYDNQVVVVFRVLTDKASIEDAQITLEKTSYAFDGNAKTPAVTVVLNGKTLINGQDYTVSYAHNVDPGTASAVVKGLTVTGEKTVNFTIEKIPQNPAADVDVITVSVGSTKKFNVSGSHTPLAASGVKNAIATAAVSEQTISVKGVKVGTYELTIKAAANDVYAAATVRNKSGNAGTITIKVVPAKTASVILANANKGIKITWKKVTGATGYVIKRQAGSGSWTTVKTVTGGNVLTHTDTAANTNGTKYTYRVYAKAATGTSDKYTPAVCYKVLQPTIKSVVNTASKKMTVKWAKNAKANGYQIQYSLKSNFSGAKTLTMSKNTLITKTQGGLTKGKKYYVRLRTYKKVGSKNYYSTWSPTKTVTIKK